MFEDNGSQLNRLFTSFWRTK